MHCGANKQDFKVSSAFLGATCCFKVSHEWHLMFIVDIGERCRAHAQREGIDIKWAFPE